MLVPTVLVVRATSDLAYGLCLHDLAEADVVFEPLASFEALERVCLHLHGSGPRTKWCSRLSCVDIVKGSWLLDVVQTALMSRTDCDAVVAAEEAASAIFSRVLQMPPGAGPLYDEGRAGRRRVLLIEEVSTAARRECRAGARGRLWQAASRIEDVVPSLVAILAVRYDIVTITSPAAGAGHGALQRDARAGLGARYDHV